MTADELRKIFVHGYELDKWPETYKVDHETYANCCQAVFDAVLDGNINRVSLGDNGGLMFKNVELILLREE